ncbi:MAG TPA: metalloregulator ArsR/SmtB family transcription factor [Acidimicrobiales bacterium]|nr:metalloregulator ArsR/SmtB family transcription factor [Acidimicrobiales bacterium]
MPARPVTKAPATSDPLCCDPLTRAALSPAEAEDLAPVLAALGDPVRLRLLSIVAAEGEACSCNLEVPLGKSQPTISHHTRVLAEAGLIVGDKRGKWTWWRVVPARLATLRHVLGGS